MVTICASSISAGAWPQFGNSKVATLPLLAAGPRLSMASTVLRASKSECSPRRMSTGHSI
ncbi:hypothetical protein AWB68_08600 [Caballeronia choica]|uniref:Uncharacterized protein n=1 Tax=Caballeronia choica TaxID=326476 RepID=A0A158L519_9BURK|nr:hypothetical protein AWB68_08600 [Caballeronia choica]